MSEIDVYLRRGWYASQVEPIAVHVARWYVGRGYGFFDNAFEGARDGLLAAIYDSAAADDLDYRDGWRAARNGASQFDRAARAIRGGNTHALDGTLTRGAVLYGDQRTHQPLEDRVLDRLALRQVWAALTDTDRRTLTVQAMHDTQADAAAAEGIPLRTFGDRVAAARRAALRCWFDHERPPQLPPLQCGPKPSPPSGDDRRDRHREACRRSYHRVRARAGAASAASTVMQATG